jgi:hypothetical protein
MHDIHTPSERSTPRKSGELRRIRRIPFTGPLTISWMNDREGTASVRGACIDFCESGLRIESPEPVPRGTRVHFRFRQINLAGTATVKHVTRRAVKYVLGVEFTQPLRKRVDTVEAADAVGAADPVATVL